MMRTVQYRHPHRTVSTWVSDGADVSIGRWRLTAMVTTLRRPNTAVPTKHTTTPTTHIATLTTIGGSYQLVRGRASFVTSPRIIRHEVTYLMIRADDDNHGASKHMVYNGYRTPPHDGDGARGKREAAKRKCRALPAIREPPRHMSPPPRGIKKISAMPGVMALRIMESVVAGATWRLYYIIR